MTHGITMKINEWSYASTPPTLCVQNIFTHYKTTVSAVML